MFCASCFRVAVTAIVLTAMLSNLALVAADQPDCRPGEQTVYRRAVVAADHPAASRAGIEVLKQGGNVVDAAVATSFALSVVRPASCGIGGGGFMLIWNADEQVAVALDYRERAPHKATRDMFAGREEEIQKQTALSQKGHLAPAVPGTVAGLCFAVEHYGLLDLETVMAPAIGLAREGVAVDEHTREVQRAALAEFVAHPEYKRRFAALYAQYLNGGESWKAGDVFHSPQHKVLELIAQQGARAFYAGPVAGALVAESRRGGGLLTHADLGATEPVVRRPVQGRFESLDVLGMPPPSSGGVALIQSLNILSAYEDAHRDSRLERLGRNSPPFVHLVTESLKHAFADRAEYLGDTDFVDVPIERLTSRKYAKTLAQRIDPKRTQPLKSYGNFVAARDDGTSHFSVIDHRGNAVACTETINTMFGSFVVEPKYGIVLNNEMDDFAAVPAQPNAYGLIQSDANAVEPRKKPLSSMSPTVVLRDGRAVYAVGASGGPRIISTTLEVLLGLTRFDMQPAEAVTAPRFHHQWLPDVMYVEDPLYESVRAALERRDHLVERRNGFSVSQAVSRSPDGLRGGSDPRRGGQPAGF